MQIADNTLALNLLNKAHCFNVDYSIESITPGMPMCLAHFKLHVHQETL